MLSRSAVLGAVAVGVLAAAPPAVAANKDKSPKQRVDRQRSEQYSAQVTFGDDDQPNVTARRGLRETLARNGKVIDSGTLPRARLTDGAHASAEGYTCVNNRTRKGFVAYAPRPMTRDTKAYYERFVFHFYKQNNARRLQGQRRSYATKQWEGCSVGGAQTRGGNHLSRVMSGMTMHGPDRLRGWKWGKGKELSNAKASLKFAVPVSPVTIEGSVDVYPTYTFTGSQGPDKDAPGSWDTWKRNQVNSLWEGSSTFRWQGSTHFQGNVGHALWELPQHAHTPPVEYTMNVRRFCGHPGGIGCS
jgi:hypothetical protein